MKRYGNVKYPISNVKGEEFNDCKDHMKSALLAHGFSQGIEIKSYDGFSLDFENVKYPISNVKGEQVNV